MIPNVFRMYSLADSISELFANEREKANNLLNLILSLSVHVYQHACHLIYFIVWAEFAN